jgi:hypothetical protein
VIHECAHTDILLVDGIPRDDAPVLGAGGRDFPLVMSNTVIYKNMHSP